MKVRSALLGTALLAATLPGIALADHLAAPTGVTCSKSDSDLSVSWDAVTGATKYSVDIVASYSGGAVTQKWTFSALASPLVVSVASLAYDHDAAIETAPLQAEGADAKVKGLHPGNGQGRQNNTFNNPTVTCSGF